MDHSVAEAIVNDTDDRIVILDAKIADLRETIEAQQMEIDGLTEKLKDSDRSRQYYYDDNIAKQRELTQLHQMIDLLPNSPPRASEPPEGQPWNKIDYTVANRLTAWIATLKR